ncbi:MAG: AsmA family protein [Pseudohongiella sp.]|nr:AsmA family protein [Pseudohongiella sp.]
MNKLLKFLIVVVAALVLFSVAVVFVLFTVIDPNRYRGTLETLVARQSGLQLTIAGDMSWTFRPVFGLNINDVRLVNPASPQELASFSTISLKLAPLPLLRGQLEMGELFAENLHVNWIVDSQGNSNWPVNRPDSPAPAESSPANEIPVNLNIEQITIHNASFSLQDQQRGINTTLQNVDINSTGTNLEDRPFQLSVSMKILDATAGHEFDIAMRSTAAVNIDAGSVRLTDMQLDLSPLILNGEISVSDFLGDLSWQTRLSSNNFPLPHLLANFALADENLLPSPDQQRLGIQELRARGDLSGLRIEQLDLGLGASGSERVMLQSDVVFAGDNSPMRVTYQLNSSGLDIDSWMPAAVTGTPDDSAEQPTAPAADIELPLEFLNSMNIRGSHNIASLKIGGLEFSPLQFGLVLENGELAIDADSAGFYGGALDVVARLNARRSPAQLALATALNNVNAEALTADIPALGFFNGRFDLNTTHQMTGNTVNTLLNSITGSSQLQVSESTVNITLLKQVFSAISVLSPRGEMAASWPDVVQVNNTEAVLTFSNGLMTNQVLSLRLDNFDIAGTGGIDLQNSRFDYQMAFTVLGEPAPQSLVVSEDFQNVSWPVRCNAAFSDPALRYCSPDLQRVRETFVRIARDEVERRAADAVGTQVERVRDRLRSIFQ